MPVALKVPEVGESITEVMIGEWRKNEGDPVERDEEVVVIETEKATVEVPAPASGILSQIVKKGGDKAAVGEVIGYLETAEVESRARPRVEQGEEERRETEKPAERTKAEPRPEPKAERQRGAAARREAEEKKPGVEPTAEEEEEAAPRKIEEVQAKTPPEAPPRLRPVRAPVSYSPAQTPPGGAESKAAAAPPRGERREEIVAMTPIRRRIAERLVEAQQTTAFLTTFNEIDMSAANSLRQEYQEAFRQQYGIKLGLMSFFIKATVDALKLIPQVNAEIRGADIVYRNYYDIGVAVGGGKGLVVPVLRNAHEMSFAEIEQAIADFARRAQTNQLRPEDLEGGTFTISNGGIYGSLLSTPIINPPQSGILGMHAIQERPVARNGAVVIRPMMYVALTYDHRIVDGREAVTFLKRIKECVESPSRMLLGA
jgi:2-oxoglutarate dehydrogenase E2 component (dihydrolipoamide succinyltransferase)